MTRGFVRCLYCTNPITAIWELQDHATCQPPASAPKPTPTAEDVQRKAKRLHWQLVKMGNRMARWDAKREGRR